MRDFIIHDISIIGKGHIANNLPNQDRTQVKTMNGTTVIALSDGCGSSKHADLGAELTVNALTDLLIHEFDEIIRLDALKGREKILHFVLNILEKEAEIKGFNIKDLNATLLFVAVNQHNQALMGRIGDGFIGGVQHGVLGIRSLEKKLTEVNETIYPSSVNAIHAFDLRRGNVEDFDAFIIMSDGSADSLVDSTVPFEKKFSKGVAGILDYASNHTVDETNRFLEDYIIKIRDRTHDDCSLALMTVPKLIIDSIATFKLEKPKEINEEPESQKDGLKLFKTYIKNALGEDSEILPEDLILDKIYEKYTHSLDEELKFDSRVKLLVERYFFEVIFNSHEGEDL